MGTSNRRRQILVHSTQKKFAIGLGLTLFAYSLFLFTIAFFVPYFYPALKTLSASLPFLNNTWPAFWYVTGILWPVLVCLIIMTAIFSLYLTHKVAGPLYRLKVCAKELEQGNVSIRVRLRQGDELQDLAEATDRGVVAINKRYVFHSAPCEPGSDKSSICTRCIASSSRNGFNSTDTDERYCRAHTADHDYP